MMSFYGFRGLVADVTDQEGLYTLLGQPGPNYGVYRLCIPYRIMGLIAVCYLQVLHK